ncbi:MAG TPA: ABC transporter permease [Bacteroides sp.]|nr:ABC transporter permease [Bacteroides sp.]
MNNITLKPFLAMVRKEVADHVRSWRSIILLGIVALTCMGSLYTSLSNFTEAVSRSNAENDFFFLNLFTLSDGTLPSFIVFVSFLGPLLGISLGFDAINSEQNKGTLSRILAQPVPRDYLLNAKFVAGLAVVSIMFFTLSFLVLGTGLIALGIPPTAGEFIRMILYTIISIVYVSFWLNLSILFSVRFRQPATAALAGIAVWLFLTVFYPLIVNLVLKGIEPSEMATPRAVYIYQKLRFGLVQVMPGELFNEITSTLLVPSVRSIGPLTMEQLHGTIPGPLPVGQSLLIVWPQLTGLIALTLLCFVLSYLSFMRREIRSR